MSEKVLIDVNEAIQQLEIREEWQPKNEVCPYNKNGEFCVPLNSIKTFLRNRPVIDPEAISTIQE